jgi:GTPase SAR1 family protein
MDTYQGLKKKLLENLNDLDALLARGDDVPGMTDRLFEEWKATCGSIRSQLSEEMIRVAVVGPIKSGKSTFVNALIQGDHLKRGAGVVTSIVTKIRQGKKLQAKLFFKSWDEVNADINQALTLLPDFSLKDEDAVFDIRRSGERRILEDALAGLRPDQLVSNGAVDANSVLLGSYLKGYDKVRKILKSDNVTLVYKGGKFEQHRDFVANDPLSVYLKDIRLEIVSDALTDYLEIADCQGSDSPNPHHLAMIQDYLNLTHLVIYVISSRTGLRQADIRFLSMIKKMGLVDNILFVVNCDFNEHESMADLDRLVSRVKEDLSYIKPDHTLFVFSALLNLFRIEKSRLSAKDKRRLEQWEMEKKTIAFSDSQKGAFEAFLEKRLNQEKYALLLKNHIERMRLMVSGTSHWVQVNQAVLTRDEDQITDIAGRIDTYRNGLDRIKDMVQHTLEGSVAKLKAELRRDVDRLFEKHTEGIQASVSQFIRQYDVRVDGFGSELEDIGFTSAMYRVYQEFKQAMDMFMADTINPRLIRFVREKEGEIYRELSGLVASYEVMVEDSLTEFDRSLVQIGIDSMDQTMRKNEMPGLDSVKVIAGIKLPPAVATLRYSAKIKTEAVLRLGFYNAVKVLKQVLKKPFRNELERQKNALRDGGQRMKHETEKSMQSHLKDYRENIKFQYLFRLADAVAEALKDTMIGRLQAYAGSLIKMIDDVRDRKLDKTRSMEMLGEMHRQAAQIDTSIQRLEDGIRGLEKKD